MLCKNCNINDATIHLYTNLNGKQQQVDLCHNCYQIMKTDPNNAILRGLGDLTNPNNMDPFSEFFNHLGGYPGNTPAGKIANRLLPLKPVGIMDVVDRPLLRNNPNNQMGSLKNLVSTLPKLPVVGILIQ